ncbi:MAG TPA: ABC transporter permease [Kofleriaceae bacterium]|nr:ABC transporter permease [Kofleriaceae bacterium]
MAGLLFAFMVLPVVALWVTLKVDDLLAGIADPRVVPALKLSLVTTFLSLAIIIILGTPLAWLLAQRDGRLTRLVETVVRLPVVMPPAVAGIALLLAFGREGIVGSWLGRIGWSIPFSTAAVVMAQIFVSAPFYLQAAASAFRAIDRDQLIVATTLGASPARVFFRVGLPLCASSLTAGAAMSWARALGEFGATLMFAGNLSGTTQTLTLAVYTTFQSDMRAAQAISLVLVSVAFTLLLVLIFRARGTTEGHP